MASNFAAAATIGMLGGRARIPCPADSCHPSRGKSLLFKIELVGASTWLQSEALPASIAPTSITEGHFVIDIKELSVFEGGPTLEDIEADVRTLDRILGPVR